MDSMPVAFSVHNFISSVGADAGFAAIIGLAVLILLYFAHARETANLREEASILADRLRQAEARVAELSRPQSVAAVVPAPASVQVTDQRGVAAPFAPAGLAAPALAAATRVVPLPESERAPSVAQPAVAMAAAPLAAAAVSPPVAPPSESPAPAPAPATAPATAPVGVNGPGGPATGLPAPATSAGANGGSRGAVPAVPAARPSGPSSASPPRQLPPLPPPAGRGGSAGRRIAIGLLALGLVAVAVVALVIATQSNSSTPKVARTTPTTNAPAPRRSTAFVPSLVTVSVLNGTATNQLAHRVAAKLATSGYKEGKIATAANQTATTTVVAYLPGAKNRTAALHVATALNLKPTAVQPIDQGTQQVACPPPGVCAANVVVTVGADLATL